MQYDNERFMSADYERRYYNNLLENKNKTERGIDDEKLAESLQDFSGCLKGKAWTCVIPTPCTAN